MAIQFKFTIEGSDEEFENPMDAVYAAMALSGEQGGAPVKLQRCVLYSARTEWQCYTLQHVTMPKEAIEAGVEIRDSTDPLADQNYMRF